MLLVLPTPPTPDAESIVGTIEHQAACERRAAVRDAVKLLGEGRRGYAYFKLARSVERQNRLLGGGTIPLHPCPQCGRVCRHNEAGALR